MYSLKDVYPDLAGISTVEQTVPERAEQVCYEQLDADEVAPVPASNAGNIWMSLIVLLILLWLFNFI